MNIQANPVPDHHEFQYLATPYAKYAHGREMAYTHACIAAAALIKQGVFVFCPIAMSHGISVWGEMDGSDHDVWIPLDHAFMSAASGLIVVQMPGWRDSVGVDIEIQTFRSAGKPIQYMQWPMGLETGALREHPWPELAGS